MIIRSTRRSDTAEVAAGATQADAIVPAQGKHGLAVDQALGDLRFRALLTDAEWSRLPPTIRQRFSKRLAGGRTVIYAGRVTDMAVSRAGTALAQLVRLIGGPLPTSCDVDVPSVVTVTEDMSNGGQVWTRLYARRRGFPQVIHSSKRFGGPTGLEEHVGCGVGMTLKVCPTERALIFKSERYFIDLGRLRVMLPRWLCPGDLTVTHGEIDATHFAFSLDLVHPWLGTLIHQRAVFEEAPS
jgi:Domain of unknown function (DUF4166)